MINKLTLKDKKAISYWAEKSGRNLNEYDFPKIRGIVIREKGKFRYDKTSRYDETKQFNRYIYDVLEAAFPKV